MSTYYEILQIQPDAGETEIVAAFDRQYDYWRRLVNHHDPAKQIEANQELQRLEKIRSTLTDSKQRAAYDNDIRVAGVTGGLIDPSAGQKFPLGASPPPPPGFKRPGSTATNVPWQCAKCGTQNEKGNIHCQTCGSVIGQKCPNCDTTFEARAAFCPQCGENPTEFRARQERERQSRELARRQEKEEREKQAILAQQAQEARIHEGIAKQLDQIQLALNQKKYRAALEELTDFQGLGKAKRKTTPSPTWNQARPEWEQARALNEIAYKQKNKLILSTLPLTAVGSILFAIIAVEYFYLGGYIYELSWRLGISSVVLAAGIGLALGIGGPILYYTFLGGRQGSGFDRAVAIASPIGLGILLIVLGIVLYIVFIIVVIVIFIFMLGAVAGGG